MTTAPAIQDRLGVDRIGDVFDTQHVDRRLLLLWLHLGRDRHGLALWAWSG